MQAPTGIFDHDTITLMIIKVLAETKNQSADEIRRAITKDGADGIIGNKVLDGMIRSRSYFDRTTGNGSGARYTLKKHIAKEYKSSGIDGIQQRIVDTVKELGVDAPEAVKIINMVSSATTSTFGRSPERTAMELALLSASNSMSVPRSPHDPEVVTKTAVPAFPVLDLEKDSVDVAIWKVMSDGHQYTVQDLEVLLSDAKMFSVKSVSPRMSILRKSKMIVRAIERSGRTIKYELIPGYPMPQNVGIGPQEKQTRNYKNKASPLAADPTLPPNTLAPKISDVAIPKETIQIKKEEDMNAPAKKNVKVPVTLPQGYSPLKVMITICGIEYSMADLKAIVGTFDSHFDVLNPKHDIPNSLVAVEYKVGDMTFSLSGARRLVADYKKFFE